MTWSPYLAWIAATPYGVDIPYSEWLSAQWRRYLADHQIVRRSPRIIHGVVDMTDAERLHYVKAEHTPTFLIWLQGQEVPDGS